MSRIVPSNKLYLLTACLHVEALGAWFTSGGEKGSFGYYPHLTQWENNSEYPIFPDTQVHGDLKEAATWLTKIPGSGFAVEETLVSQIFGGKGNASASLLSATDLELQSESKARWSPDRFMVRTRCEIDDTTRSNKRNMLAQLQVAYLRGFNLSSDLYLGYFKSDAAAKRALEILRASLDLLEAMGADRSRGKGRGKFTIREEKIDTITAPDSFPQVSQQSYHLTLEPLVHFRNRSLNPARTQLLRSQAVISSDQLRAAVARAFFDLYGSWPTIAEMDSLKFSSFYPCLLEGDKVIPAFPAPFSTLQLSDDTIKDFYDQNEAEKEAEEEDDRDLENFFRTKPKPVSEGNFLTNEQSPRVVQTHCKKRMRNHTDPTGSFATLKEGGLFAQEFIPRGTLFSGTVNLEKPSAEFSGMALFLLQNLLIRINGAFFRACVYPAAPVSPANSPDGQPCVLVEPYHYSKHAMLKTTQARLGVARSFNTELKRPRRNRIVFSPGSLMKDDCGGLAVIWKGLNKPDGSDAFSKKTIPTPAETEKAVQTKQEKTDATETKEHAKKHHESTPTWLQEARSMSRTQVGKLREIIYMNPDVAVKKLAAVQDKYIKWKLEKPDARLVPPSILKKVLKLLESEDKEALEKNLQRILQEHAESEWNKKKERIAQELEKRKAEEKHGTP